MSLEAKVVRLYEGKHLAENYEKYRPSYPPFVRNLILEQMRNCNPGVDKFERMLDVGCGSGQATFMFESDFDSILGIDISEAQIEKAKEINKSENIEFQVVHDNLFPIADQSVDLVTAATAAHWFDMDIFVRECERVLKPDGCVILYTYLAVNAQIANRKNSIAEYSSDFIDIYLEFLQNSKAHPGNYKYMDKYKTIFGEINNRTKRWISTPVNTMILSVKGFLQGMSTNCDYSKFMEEEKPEVDPLQICKKSLIKYLGVEDGNDEDILVSLTMHYPMIVFQKLGDQQSM